MTAWQKQKRVSGKGLQLAQQSALRSKLPPERLPMATTVASRFFFCEEIAPKKFTRRNVMPIVAVTWSGHFFFLTCVSGGCHVATMLSLLSRCGWRQVKQISITQKLRLANLICKLERWNKPNGPTVADIARDVSENIPVQPKTKKRFIYSSECTLLLHIHY